MVYKPTFTSLGGTHPVGHFLEVMGLLEVGVLRNWPGLTGSPTSLTPVLWREWLISMAQLMGMVVVCCQNRVQ